MFSDMALIMQGRFISISYQHVLHNPRFNFRLLAIKLHALTIRSLVGVVWIVAWPGCSAQMRKHVQVPILKGVGAKEEELPDHSYNFLLYHNLWTAYPWLETGIRHEPQPVFQNALVCLQRNVTSVTILSVFLFWTIWRIIQACKTTDRLEGFSIRNPICECKSRFGVTSAGSLCFHVTSTATGNSNQISDI